MPYEYYSHSLNSLNVIIRILIGTTVFFSAVLLFLLHHKAGRILVPPPGIKAMPLAVKALSPITGRREGPRSAIISSPRFTEEDAEAQGG